jgi:hypothetical protein
MAIATDHIMVSTLNMALPMKNPFTVIRRLPGWAWSGWNSPQFLQNVSGVWSGFPQF